MEALSKQIYSCVSSAVNQFITQASSKLDVDQYKLMEIWNSSVSSELKIETVSTTTARKPGSKPDPNAKQCVHIGTRGKSKGEQCSSKASADSTKGFCKKHMKGETASPVENKPATKSTSASSFKTTVTPAVASIKVESLHIKINNFGNYQNANGIVFDRATHEAYGRQSPEGKVIPLTADDIRECKQYGYKYRIPEQLKTKEDNEEEEVEVVEEEEEEEEEEEDN
jgi:hypothetical protein